MLVHIILNCVYSLHDKFSMKIAETSVSREGWLRKKGTRVNVWGERYFVLKGPSLAYYLKQGDLVRNYEKT